MGRSRMTRLPAWWQAMSGAAKFRFYTRVTLQFAVLVLIVVAVTTTSRPLWASAGLAVAGLAALLALEAQPEFARPSAQALRRWAIPMAGGALFAVWVAYAVVARAAGDGPVYREACASGVYTAMIAVFAIVSFLRYRWWAVAAVGVATGVAFATTPLAALVTALLTGLGGAFVVGTTLLTLWGLRVVDELERARVVEAELQVAEERLRFARDLHDIVGRGFSAIAVKSELAAALSRSGDSGRAAAEMDEVKTLAVESMGQMRQLVRGYRGIDLRAEVAGARSLLSALGCELVVEGDPARVPTRFHEVAAWVVREGTTNIVEHSSATAAVLTLGAAGMSLRNDRPNGTAGEHSGLRGLAERLAAAGATLGTESSSAAFVLEIHWEKS
ncbi:sensor histidine kinase [Nocardia sp. NPDC127579]|uniref:sensor histidine kinase n=1 Tax=Nocardia sp. NPDC127579 TaxID=3345402 RepID=UPI0036457760